MTAEASAIDNATQPKVIIRCLVYNHEPYLRDCLEGFVMQKTNFPFKAVVHDDCSTDGSAAIIREYAEKYPDIIEPIYEKENLYSKRDGSLKRAMDKATLNRSQYVAYCEGDDFWIDPLKLQKQVDFLESHPNYSMCFHNAEIIVQDGRKYVDSFSKLEEREYSAREIVRSWFIPTASIIRRASVEVPFHKDFANGDVIVHAACVSAGKVYCINEKLSVYRLHAGGWSAPGKHHDNYTFRLIPHYIAMMQIFPKTVTVHLKDHLAWNTLYWLKHIWGSMQYISISYLPKAILYSNTSLVHSIMAWSIRKIRAIRRKGATSEKSCD